MNGTKTRASKIQASQQANTKIYRRFSHTVGIGHAVGEKLESNTSCSTKLHVLMLTGVFD